MQFKTITVIIVLLLLVVASLSVAGCTTSNTSTATPPATATAQGAQPIPGAADNLAGDITAYYKKNNYTVNTPFTMNKSGDTITYTGVVTDGGKPITPYKRNITIVLTPNRTSARTIYQTAIDKQKALGFQTNLVSNSSIVYWVGYLGMTSENPSVPRVFVMLAQSESSGTLRLPDSSGFSNGFLYNENMKDYLEVITDQATPVT